MGYWKATCKCLPLNIELDADRIIKLNEEQEKELKLGKFAETVKDQNTGKEVVISFAHLVKPSKRDLERIDENEAKAIEDGFVIYPPQFHSQSLDEKQPFRLQRQ
jgi:phosphate uptake regulator